VAIFAARVRGGTRAHRRTSIRLRAYDRLIVRVFAGQIDRPRRIAAPARGGGMPVTFSEMTWWFSGLRRLRLIGGLCRLVAGSTTRLWTLQNARALI